MHSTRLSGWWDFIVASDPGLARLTQALQVGLAIGTGIAAQYGFAQLLHPLWTAAPTGVILSAAQTAELVSQHHGVTLLSMLLGGLMTLISMLVMSETTPREQSNTLALWVVIFNRVAIGSRQRARGSFTVRAQRVPLQRDLYRRDELQRNLVLLSSTAHFARHLRASVDEICDVAEQFSEPVCAAATDEVELGDRVIDAVRDQTGPPPASPPLEAVLDVARRLVAEGVARDDPRRRLLRMLVRLDGTVEQLARNLTGRDPAPALAVPTEGFAPPAAGQEAG